MYLCSGRKIKASILMCLNACYQNVADASRFVFQIFKLRTIGSEVKHNTEVWTQWVSCKVSDAQGVTLTLRSYFDEQQKNKIHLLFLHRFCSSLFLVFTFNSCRHDMTLIERYIRTITYFVYPWRRLRVHCVNWTSVVHRCINLVGSN